MSRRQFLAAAGAGAAGLAALGLAGCDDDQPPASTPAATATPAAPSDLSLVSLEEAAALIQSKQVSPVDLTEAMLARIERLQPRFRAFITVTGEQAFTQARAAEREIAAGNYRGKLHGIPIAHKDLFDTAGVRTTYGSKVYDDHVPDEDATVVARLSEAGAIVLGKLNMWEFAPSASAINPWWGTVPNPWNTDYISGGSSSGPGVATATGLMYAATGTDFTGGIRHPAAFCGIVGLMPTYGRVSGYGAFRGAKTLDPAGPLTRTVRDAAIMLQSMAGFDSRDDTSQNQPVPDYLEGIESGAKGIRIGVPSSFFWDDVDPEVETAVRAAITELEKAGAELEEVTFERAADYYTAMRVVLAIENRITHAPTYPSRKADYGKVSAALLDAVQGTQEELDSAMEQSLTVIRQARSGEADANLEGVDVLVAPTTRNPPLTINEAQGLYDRADIAEIETRSDPKNTAVFNATGQPSISVPCGSMSGDIPVGLMFVARKWDEPTLLRAARAYEMVRGPFANPPV